MEIKDLCTLNCRVSEVSGVSQKSQKEFKFYTFNLEVGDYLLALSLKDVNGVSQKVLEKYLESIK